MKLFDYLQTREGALKENKISRIIIGVLACAVLMLAFAAANQKTTVVLVPPTLDANSSVGATSANSETKVAWGMYLAGLLGNITPTSAEFLKDSVSKHLSPRMYSPIREAIEQQVKLIQEEQITTSFTPTMGRYEADIDRVIVTGEVISRGRRGGAERREVRTYEMKFVTRNYNVLLDDLRTIEGKYSDASKRESK